MPADDAAAATPIRRGPSGLAIATAVVFGLFYAYDVWEGFGSLLELPGYYRSIGISASRVPWFLLVAGVAVPLVAYLLALFLGRKRAFLDRVVILFVGLAAVAALTLAIIDLGPLLT
jgi:hypothetical protein